MNSVQNIRGSATRFIQSILLLRACVDSLTYEIRGVGVLLFCISRKKTNPSLMRFGQLGVGRDDGRVMFDMLTGTRHRDGIVIEVKFGPLVSDTRVAVTLPR